MKIVIVGGDDVAADEPSHLGAALAAHGHEVAVYLRQGDRGSTRQLTDRAAQIVELPVGPVVARSAADVLPFVGDWAGILQRRWSSDEPDVVHAFGWLGGLAAQLAARQQNRPVVQTFHGLASVSRTRSRGNAGRDVERQRIEPLLARNAAWVTVESTADVLPLARLRRGRTRVSVLASGVDAEQYTPVGPVAHRGDRGRILCLAPNPLPDNGFDIALRALSRVPGAELLLAETDANHRRHGEARSALKRLATQLRVADRVRFLGAADANELPTMLRSADLVACTPRQPPRAQVALQAMASGVAVVALPVGVLADVVVDDVTGLVLPTHKPSDLSAALRSLLAQTFRRNGMGAAGRSRVLSRFTWDRVALDALSIYGSLRSHHLSSSSPQPTGAR